MPLNVFIKLLEDRLSKDYSAGGFFSGKITFCSLKPMRNIPAKIIALIGMDLGYYAETPYRETQYYHELCELVGEANLDQVFVHMQNPHMQQDFYTDPAYLWYRDSFLQMAGRARAAGVTTYNCTGGGILFGEGIEFASFDSFVKESN